MLTQLEPSSSPFTKCVRIPDIISVAPFPMKIFCGLTPIAKNTVTDFSTHMYAYLWISTEQLGGSEQDNCTT